VTLHPFAIAAALAVVVATVHPARADRCDDLAGQLARQIDGLKVGTTRAGIIYLTHPAVKQATLGCSARNKQNEIFAMSPARKPSKEFFDFVASATALVFTIPKDDALRGGPGRTRGLRASGRLRARGGVRGVAGGAGRPAAGQREHRGGGHGESGPGGVHTHTSAVNDERDRNL